ncbi:MAG: hypothetical protein HPY74_19630 [Firmicutes bacterium]|nr:hypothetical protein [Bacillota bacterium]
MFEQYVGKKVSFRIRVTKEEISGTVKEYSDGFLVVNQVTRYGDKREIVIHKNEIAYLILRQAG